LVKVNGQGHTGEIVISSKKIYDVNTIIITLCIRPISYAEYHQAYFVDARGFVSGNLLTRLSFI